MAAASASARGQASLLLMRQLKGMLCGALGRGGVAIELATGRGCVGCVASNGAFAPCQSLVGLTASNMKFCSLCYGERPLCIWGFVFWSCLFFFVCPGLSRSDGGLLVWLSRSEQEHGFWLLGRLGG